MTTREKLEQIAENAPHLDAIHCSINALMAAAGQAKDVYNCTNQIEYLNDAEECAKLASNLEALYCDIFHREAANLQASAAMKYPFEGDKPEDIWVTKRFEDDE